MAVPQRSIACSRWPFVSFAMVRSHAALAAGAAAAAASAASLAHRADISPEKGPGPKRRRLGRIDLDDKIAEAKLKEKLAKAAVKATRAEIRNEKRRRSRLVKKAANLSVEDLEQIAKLKKAGLWDPVYGVGGDAPDGPPVEAAKKSASASGSGERTDISPVAVPLTASPATPTAAAPLGEVPADAAAAAAEEPEHLNGEESPVEE